MTDLLPCPFCGGEARHNNGGNSTYGRMWWCVGCNQCDFFLQDIEKWLPYDEDAQSVLLDPAYPAGECLTRWNTRAAPTLAAALAVPEIAALVAVMRAIRDMPDYRLPSASDHARAVLAAIEVEK